MYYINPDYLNKSPLLSKDEEIQCFNEYINTKSTIALNKIITSNLRFVIHISQKYKNCNIPLDDLIQEGIIGIIKAAHKFNPNFNVRFISYAVFYIKDHIQSYILKFNDVMYTITSKNLRKLQFNHRDTNYNTNDIPQRDIDLYNKIKQIEYIDVYESNISDFKSTLDTLLDYEYDSYIDIIYQAMEILNEKEKDIFISRNILDNPVTLTDLGKKYNVSYERIRQIESKSKTKLISYINQQLKLT